LKGKTSFFSLVFLSNEGDTSCDEYGVGFPCQWGYNEQKISIGYRTKFPVKNSRQSQKFPLQSDDFANDIARKKPRSPPILMIDF